MGAPACRCTAARARVRGQALHAPRAGLPAGNGPDRRTDPPHVAEAERGPRPRGCSFPPGWRCPTDSARFKDGGGGAIPARSPAPDVCGTAGGNGSVWNAFPHGAVSGSGSGTTAGRGRPGPMSKAWRRGRMEGGEHGEAGAGQRGCGSVGLRARVRPRLRALRRLPQVRRTMAAGTARTRRSTRSTRRSTRRSTTTSPRRRPRPRRRPQPPPPPQLRPLSGAAAGAAALPPPPHGAEESPAPRGSAGSAARDAVKRANAQ